MNTLFDNGWKEQKIADSVMVESALRVTAKISIIGGPDERQIGYDQGAF